MNNKIIVRGDVWLVDLDPTVGHEQAKKRPCIVISADLFNKGKHGLAAIMPLTSKYKPLSWLVKIEPPEGGLKVVSYAIGYQIRVVSIDRFLGKSLGRLQPRTIQEIEQKLRILLAL